MFLLFALKHGERFLLEKYSGYDGIMIYIL